MTTSMTLGSDTVHSKSLGVAICLLALLAVACGSDGSSKGDEIAAGGNAGADDGVGGGTGAVSAGTGGGTGGTGGSSGVCRAERTPVLLGTVNALTDEFTVHGDDVFVVDSGTPENGAPDRIRRLALDGSADEIVHVAELELLDFLGFSLALDDTYIYYAHAPGLMRVPQAGGEAEQVSLPGTDLNIADTILAADGEFAYMSRDQDSLLRISVEDGSETVLAEHDETLYDLQVFDGYIWYKLGFLAAGGIYNTPLAADGPSERAQVSTAPCAVYRMSVTEQGIVCSDNFSLLRYGFDAEEPTVLLEESGGVHASAPDGDKLYLYPAEATTDRTIYAIPSAGGDRVPVACAEDAILKLSFNDDYIVWLEIAVESVDTETLSLYTVAK